MKVYIVTSQYLGMYVNIEGVFYSQEKADELGDKIAEENKERFFSVRVVEMEVQNENP